MKSSKSKKQAVGTADIKESQSSKVAKMPLDIVPFKEYKADVEVSRDIQVLMCSFESNSGKVHSVLLYPFLSFFENTILENAMSQFCTAVLHQNANSLEHTRASVNLDLAVYNKDIVTLQKRALKSLKDAKPIFSNNSKVNASSFRFTGNSYSLLCYKVISNQYTARSMQNGALDNDEISNKLIELINIPV